MQILYVRNLIYYHPNVIQIHGTLIDSSIRIKINVPFIPYYYTTKLSSTENTKYVLGDPTNKPHQMIKVFGQVKQSSSNIYEDNISPVERWLYDTSICTGSYVSIPKQIYDTQTVELKDIKLLPTTTIEVKYYKMVIVETMEGMGNYYIYSNGYNIIQCSKEMNDKDVDIIVTSSKINIQDKNICIKKIDEEYEINNGIPNFIIPFDKSYNNEKMLIAKSMSIFKQCTKNKIIEDLVAMSLSFTMTLKMANDQNKPQNAKHAILCEAGKLGYVLNNKNLKTDYRSFRSGYNESPNKNYIGLSNCAMHEYDFASYYSSITMTWNICMTNTFSYNNNKRIKINVDESYCKKRKIQSRNKKMISVYYDPNIKNIILPKIITNIIDKRNACTDEIMKKKYKYKANCILGTFGMDKGVLSHKESYSLITYFSRMILKWVCYVIKHHMFHDGTDVKFRESPAVKSFENYFMETNNSKSIINEGNIDLVYIHTDAIIIVFKDSKIEDQDKLGKAFYEKINKLFEGTKLELKYNGYSTKNIFQSTNYYIWKDQIKGLIKKNMPKFTKKLIYDISNCKTKEEIKKLVEERINGETITPSDFIINIKKTSKDKMLYSISALESIKNTMYENCDKKTIKYFIIDNETYCGIDMRVYIDNNLSPKLDVNYFMKEFVLKPLSQLFKCMNITIDIDQKTCREYKVIKTNIEDCRRCMSRWGLKNEDIEDCINYCNFYDGCEKSINKKFL